MPDPDQRRLIEVAFPLKQASLDPVYEKNARHGTETCCVLVSFLKYAGDAGCFPATTPVR
jgi:hypothetical protein